MVSGYKTETISVILVFKKMWMAASINTKIKPCMISTIFSNDFKIFVIFAYKMKSGDMPAVDE